ncbi:Mob1/phocein family [Ceratobasidium sp. AG-Ba]|nr:Mob1/phocein family [Ceratobasidium sp. AG-Ba]
MPPNESGNTQNGTPLYLCQPFVRKFDAKKKTRLPQNHILSSNPCRYVDINEWVAVNIFDFYTNLNLFCAVISEVCSIQTCTQMTAGPNLAYEWTDRNRRAVSLPAATYTDYVMTWVQNCLDDETTFPTRAGNDFPPASSSSFAACCKAIYVQLFRVFAHVYHAHFTDLLHLHSEGHFNSLFAHFLVFGQQYRLLDAKDVLGDRGREVGVGALWERWRDMGILDV